MTDPVTLTVDDGVATIAIDGPITQLWADCFASACARAAARPDVQVVLLRGDGRLLCPGGDLRTMADAAEPHEAVRTLAATLHEGLRSLASMAAPVVARVHAPVAGAGMSLVLGSDIAIAARSASLTPAYAAVGLTPDGGLSWLLPALVGPRRALELLLTNRTLSATEAAGLGLLTAVVDDEDLDGAVAAMVDRLRDGPTSAFGATKRLVREAGSASYFEQLDAEADAIAEAAASPTGREGVAAFLQRRAAQWPVPEV